MPFSQEVIERLQARETRYQELQELMAQPEIAMDPARSRDLAKEQSSLEELVAEYQAYSTALKDEKETQALLQESQDEDMRAMAREELEQLEAKLEESEGSLKRLLSPRDPRDAKDAIVEVRGGTGGEEASLFAADLFRMYTRYAETKRWQTEVISSSETGLGGFKEIIFEVRGKGVFSRLKYESGVHRVQRVPLTETSGRIHTSTATVAVLPVADELEIAVNQEELRIDIFHAGGAGGQNVNKVATAVRITHIPTGLVVVCQDERSQLKNRTKAMGVLRARLLSLEQAKKDQEVTEARRLQVGSGERSEKSRTYNYPQDRVTDHRIEMSFHNLPRILGGELDPMIDAVSTDQEARLLKAPAV